MPHPFSLLRQLFLSLLLLFPFGELQAQTDSLRQVGVSIIKNYFDNYTAKDYRPYNPMKSESVEADTLRQVWRVVVNESFASQKLTPEVLKNIRKSVKNLLPLEMKDWELELFSNKGKRLEDLIPNELRDDPGCKMSPDPTKSPAVWTDATSSSGPVTAYIIKKECGSGSARRSTVLAKTC